LKRRSRCLPASNVADVLLENQQRRLLPVAQYAEAVLTKKQAPLLHNPHYRRKQAIRRISYHLAPWHEPCVIWKSKCAPFKKTTLNECHTA